VPAAPSIDHLAVAGDRIYGTTSRGTLFVVDRRTHAVLATERVGAGEVDLAVKNHAVYGINRQELFWIDPETFAKHVVADGLGADPFAFPQLATDPSGCSVFTLTGRDLLRDDGRAAPRSRRRADDRPEQARGRAEQGPAQARHGGQARLRAPRREVLAVRQPRRRLALLQGPAREWRGAARPELTDDRYSVYDEPHDDYLYTDAWVKKLVKELADPATFKEVTGKAPQSLPKPVEDAPARAA
jgi:hypothetical protein